MDAWNTFGPDPEPESESGSEAELESDSNSSSDSDSSSDSEPTSDREAVRTAEQAVSDAWHREPRAADIGRKAVTAAARCPHQQR